VTLFYMYRALINPNQSEVRGSWSWSWHFFICYLSCPFFP